MNRTKTNWGRYSKGFFAFSKTNKRGLTLLLMACHTRHQR
jgi:hypothetical protein